MLGIETKLSQGISSCIPVLRGFAAGLVIYLSDVNLANYQQKDFAFGKNILSVARTQPYSNHY